MLVLEYQLRHLERWAGVAVDSTVTTVDALLAGVPCYLGVGDCDPWMRPDRAWVASRGVETAGTRVTVEVFESDTHEIRSSEVATVADLVRRSVSEPTAA